MREVEAVAELEIAHACVLVLLLVLVVVVKDCLVLDRGAEVFKQTIIQLALLLADVERALGSLAVLVLLKHQACKISAVVSDTQS